jgi:alkylation response protein AidB-like acyl-CoA dehydrogenase
MFDFALTPEQRALRDRVRDFARTEIAPQVAECDRAKAIAPQIAERFHAADIASRFLDDRLDRAYLADICMVTEELAYACPSFASYLMLPVFFNRILLRLLPAAGAEALRAELASEQVMTAFCASERDAGSDFHAMAVTASPTEDGYRLDGRKEYSSNVRAARYAIVVAASPPVRADDHSKSPSAGTRLSWFVVPTASQGVRLGQRWDTLGLRAIDVSPIEFDNVFVPSDRRLGEEGAGLRLMNENLAQSRTGIAAVAVGIARRARDLVLEFGGQRRVYGDRLTRLQDYRFHISDMEREIAAARSLVWLSARKHDAGFDHGKEASIAKLYAGDMVMRLTSAAVLMLGSIGYTGQSLVEKLFRDARHVGIVEGPEPIHREIIFAETLRRGAY